MDKVGFSPIVTVVASLCVRFSIAVKNVGLYGADHPVVQEDVENLLASFEESFKYSDTLNLHFTKTTIIFGDHYLSKQNPIFVRLAGTLWNTGIIGLAFSTGLVREEITAFIRLVSTLARGGKRMEESGSWDDGAYPHLHVQSVTRDLIKVRKRERIKVLEKDEEIDLWEEFLMNLGAQEALPGSGEGVSQSVIELARKMEAASKDESTDYGTAMVSFLNNLERSHRAKGILAQSELGDKINTLISSINPELRRQILGATMTSPDLGPEVLEGFVKNVNHGHLVDSLKDLNARGQSIPISVYRTISLLGLLEGDEDAPVVDEEDNELIKMEEDNFQVLLDLLLSQDEQYLYMTPEYEAKIESLQAYAETLAATKSLETTTFQFSRKVVEDHFVGVASLLLEDYSNDEELAESVLRQVNKLFSSFVEKGDYDLALQAVLAGRRAVSVNPKMEIYKFAWNNDEMHERLLNLLADENLEVRAEIRLLFGIIGLKAVPDLVSILVTSTERVMRRQIVNILVEMDEDPSNDLIALLHQDVPWYLERNIVFILRRRKNAKALEHMEHLWKKAHPRVKIEILRYFYAVKHKGWLSYFREAMEERSKDLALGAARMAVYVRWNEVIDLIIQKVDTLPRLAVGSMYHLDMLHVLLQSENRKAKNYVVNTLRTKRAILPWRTKKFQQNLRALLKEAS